MPKSLNSGLQTCGTWSSNLKTLFNGLCTTTIVPSESMVVVVYHKKLDSIALHTMLSGCGYKETIFFSEEESNLSIDFPPSSPPTQFVGVLFYFNYIYSKKFQMVHHIVRMQKQ